MHSDLRAQTAFRVTGFRADAALPQRLRPALAARLHDLAALRYDFPVVMLAPGGDEFALPLTTVFDALLAAIDTGGEDAPWRDDLARLEREIRVAAAHGAEGTLASMWDAAVERLAVGASPQAMKRFALARQKLTVAGDVVDCDARFTQRFAMHAWKAAESRKSARLRAEVQGLLFRLRQILAADAARSPDASTSVRLRETFGARAEESIDFEAMARLLGRVSGRAPLPDARRRRILALVASLEWGHFFCGEDAEAFTFDRCAQALRAFRSRYDGLRSFMRAVAMARLEVVGAFDETRHGPLFHQLAEQALSSEDLQGLPSYLVCLRWHALDAAERADVEELLCAGLPVRIVVQFDDLLEEGAARERLAAIGSHAQALAGSALGLDDVFVVQAPASRLPAMRARIAEAMKHPGTSLVCVYSGVGGGTTALPPYLSAAAALEARVFPAFSFDPNKGEEGFSLEGNPQCENEWPHHELEFEDSSLQRTRRRVAFTASDFVAADARFARHFLPIDHSDVDEWGATDRVLVVDDADRLRELLVDAHVAAQARRCANRWRHLQRLAVHGMPREPEPESVPVADAPADAASPAAPAAPTATAAEPAAAPASGDPYIETPRCTTCNECTQINSRMFAYDANKQAYIADLSAGTYRELVEAAESCQVSIIHPGEPRNRDEPGLDELVARAEVFR